MLLSEKNHLFGFFFIFFMSYSVSFTSAQKVKRSNTPSAIMRMNEKIDQLRDRVDQLEQSNENNAFDAVHEIISNITYKISNSNDQIIHKFDENLKKFDDNFKNIDEKCKNIEKFEEKLKKIEKFDDNFKKINENFKIIETVGGKFEENFKTIIDEKFKNIEKFEENFKKIDENFIKIDKNFKKIDENFKENFKKIDENIKNTEQCQAQLKETKLEIMRQIVCHPNPCLHGGRCQLSSTGSQYQCVCPKFRSGSRCENVECKEENNCWRLNDTLYVIVKTGMTWNQAKVKCEDENMTLAMPKGEERTRLLRDRVKAIYNGWFWIGIKRDEGGDGWYWVDGSGLGAYTGGRENMKEQTGSKFGVLYLYDGSWMWSWAEANGISYPMCETYLSSP